MEFIPEIPSLRKSKLKILSTVIGVGVGASLLGSSAIHTLAKKEDLSWLVALEKQNKDNIALRFENNELTQVIQTQHDLFKALCKAYEWKDTEFNMRCEEDEEEDELE